jgi:predicted dehydrogenase
MMLQHDAMTGQDRARVGVVGSGWWATTAHLPALSRDPRAELAGVVDLDRSRAAEAAERFGAPLACDTVEELLEAGVDGVVVATPHDQHYEPTRLALEHGADVLLEKPMAIEAAEARALVALSRERGRRLDVGYPFLYTRHALALKQAFDQGELGEVVTATGVFARGMMPFYAGDVSSSKETAPDTMWETDVATWANAERGGGQMLSQVTHAASLLLHLSGLQPETLFAATDNYTTDVDVWDVIAFQARGGAIGSLTSTGTLGAGAARVEEYRIFGTEGHALLDTSEGTLVITRYGDAPREDRPLEPDEIYPMYAPAERLVSGIFDRELPDTAELGLLTVELLAGARTSAKNGSTVRLDA